MDRFRDYVSEQTLATALESGEASGDNAFRHEAQLGGEPVRIALERASA